jgi:hypothetical protein
MSKSGSRGSGLSDAAARDREVSVELLSASTTLLHPPGTELAPSAVAVPRNAAASQALRQCRSPGTWAYARHRFGIGAASVITLSRCGRRAAGFKHVRGAACATSPASRAASCSSRIGGAGLRPERPDHAYPRAHDGPRPSRARAPATGDATLPRQERLSPSGALHPKSIDFQYSVDVTHRRGMERQSNKAHLHPLFDTRAFAGRCRPPIF